MKKLFLVLCIASLFTHCTTSEDKPVFIGQGQQPEAAVDPEGIIRVAYGKSDSIFCITSRDKGKTFSEPVWVGTLPEMHLGMTRGPQIACSKNFSVITAMDKQGNIHTYRLAHAKEAWKEVARVNDREGSAPEGLMSLAADKHDHFYAVWLDIRFDKRNKIYFARSAEEGAGWTENKQVYSSPDQTVCECCQPSIAVHEEAVAIMFRNWLKGSRDLYFSKSGDGGSTFSAAAKLGEGTWKLKGCPMDGGDMIVDEAGHVASVWRRENHIYYAEPMEAEREMGQGRNCAMARSGDNTVIAWQEEGQVFIKSQQTNQKYVIGEGGFPRLAALDGGRVICVWEKEGQVFAKVI